MHPFYSEVKFFLWDLQRSVIIGLVNNSWWRNTSTFGVTQQGTMQLIRLREYQTLRPQTCVCTDIRNTASSNFSKIPPVAGFIQFKKKNVEYKLSDLSNHLQLLKVLHTGKIWPPVCCM